MNPVIVYLAQNTRHDDQYGRDSRSLLEKSLALLFKNYNDKFRHDVLIFHEGDFTKEDQVTLAGGRPQISFKEIYFQIPNFLEGEEIEQAKEYGLGHRLMIRFYSVQI